MLRGLFFGTRVYSMGARKVSPCGAKIFQIKGRIDEITGGGIGTTEKDGQKKRQGDFSPCPQYCSFLKFLQLILHVSNAPFYMAQS